VSDSLLGIHFLSLQTLYHSFCNYLVFVVDTKSELCERLYDKVGVYLLNTVFIMAVNHLNKLCDLHAVSQ